jgi:glycosyltransferase involved in cell wall biosynthesis
MLTYMAVGVPTIASSVGTSEDIMRQSTVGFPARSSHDWYQALETLHHDRALGTRLGKCGRQLVEAEYSVTHNVDKLAEIFRLVANE